MLLEKHRLERNSSGNWKSMSAALPWSTCLPRARVSEISLEGRFEGVSRWSQNRDGWSCFGYKLIQWLFGRVTPHKTSEWGSTGCWDADMFYHSEQMVPSTGAQTCLSKCAGVSLATHVSKGEAPVKITVLAGPGALALSETSATQEPARSTRAQKCPCLWSCLSLPLPEHRSCSAQVRAANCSLSLAQLRPSHARS